MDLHIEFLDGAPEMEIGQRARIRVVQADTGKVVSLVRVQFKFMPVEWGRVHSTDDPGTGVLEVVQLLDSDDPLLAPAYTIQAFLTAQANVTFQTERKIRIVPIALELELAFEVEKKDRSIRFGPQDLSRPIDWSLARVGNPENQSLFLREGRPYLRVSPVTGFPLQVSITLPNGEVATLEVQGDISATSVRATDALVRSGVQARLSQSGPAARPQQPVIQQPTPAQAQAQAQMQRPAAPAAPAPAAAVRAEGEAVREELNRLHRYIHSFSSAQRAQLDASQSESIKNRMQREVDQVRERIEAYRGPDRDELLSMLTTICEGLAEWTPAAAS
ncbi:MAG: hypothetical protein AB7N76_09465 [Planctomycetota bacterium]